MAKQKRKYLISSVVLIALIGLQGCNDSKSEMESDVQESSVDAFILEEGFISDTLVVPGELVAYQQVDLYAKVNSFVKKLYVDVGSEVKTGELLAVMEAPEIDSQKQGALSRVKAQEAVYLASKAMYDRLLETSKTPGTISQNDLDQAASSQNADHAQWESAKAEMNEIQNTQNYLEIRAPFSGMITRRNISVGAYAGTGNSTGALFTLQEQKKLRLVLNIPESNSGNLQVGQEVSFTVKSLPGQKFTAITSRFSGELDTRLRAQHIEMDVENPDKKLLPGMIPEIQVALNSGDTKSFVVPQSAVMNSTQGRFLVKVINGKTIWINVSTGIETLEKVAVYGNVAVGDTLITFASEEVRNGAAIEGKLQF